VPLTLFLCGDVMTGRGVDQILPFPSPPTIFESHVRDAREYVRLAEAVNGPIARPAAFSYIWGDAIDEFKRVVPAAGIVNLETSITRSDDYERGKGINYRMHPSNLPCLLAGRIDVCVLANNHVLDYRSEGLRETLSVLTSAGLSAVGAGETAEQAQRPAVLHVSEDSRLVIVAFGTATSGTPPSWAAGPRRAGVNLLGDLEPSTAARIADRVRAVKRPGDVAVASIHWGSNWGYDIPAAHVSFARSLVDAGIDMVHGHSSHHPRPVEVYRNRLILYGCGDLINDYEGIEGYEHYRDDLVLLYFATLSSPTGELLRLEMTPMQIRKMKLNRASSDDAEWLRATLDRVSEPFGCHVARDGRALTLRWAA
jgi:poly-gamma-glutamate synthesis protein (capsule biosynthesis protein)